MKQYLSILFRITLFYKGCLKWLIACLIMSMYWQTGYTQLSVPDLISVKFNGESLEEALVKLRSLAKVTIAYNRSELSIYPNLYQSFEQKSIHNILEAILAYTHLAYRQQGKSFIIIKKILPTTPKTGTLNGSVKDAQSKEPLIGAAVVLQNLNKGTATDENGNYVIQDIPEGEYEVLVSYVGYKQASFSKVKIRSQQETKLHINLQTDIQLEGVEVTGKITADEPITHTREIEIIDEIKSSHGIVSGISSIQIAKSLDMSAIEIMKRAPAININDDRFVMIRGLDPRYTLTMLNDFVAPSAETDKRAFAYDMIPSSVIDKVIIHKSPVPELPADYAGVVKLYTKNSVTARQLQIQLSTQYRQGTSFRDFYTYQGSPTDWLGYDDGTRDVVKDIPTQPEFTVPKAPYHGDRGLWNAVNGNAPSWNLQRKKIDLDKRANVNYYDSWVLGKTRLNNLTSLGYSIAYQTLAIPRAYIPGGPRINDDTTATESVRVNLMQNFQWILNTHHRISFNNFFNQMGNDITYIYTQVTAQDRPSGLNTYQYRYTTRSLYTGQLSGEHQWNEKNLLQWRVGYAHTSENMPNYRGFATQANYPYSKGDYAPGYSDLLIPNSRADWGSTASFQYFHKLQENVYTIAVDYTKTFAPQFFIKAGFFHEDRSRNFSIRIFTISAEQYLTQPFSKLYGKDIPFHIDEYLLPEFFISTEEGAVNYTQGYYRWEFRDQTIFHNKINGYRASNTQDGAYVAINLPVWNGRLNIYAGVRAEWNSRKLSAFELRGQDLRTYELKADTLAFNLLPSINLTYKLTNKMFFRAGYGQTINRPEFREVAPFAFFDLLRSTSIYGNTALQQAFIHNADIRWEWYLSAEELISLGVFFKDISNPIEEHSLAGSGATNEKLQFINVKYAQSYGAELEIRKKFNFLPRKFFEDLSIIANVAYIYTITETSQRRTTAVRKVRPLQGSSPYIINAGLYYDHEKSGTQVSVLYNITGQRLMYVGGEVSVGEVYELPRHVLDMTVSQRITKFLQVKIGVQNLLNQSVRWFRDTNQDTKYNEGFDPKSDFLANPITGGGAGTNKDYLDMQYYPGAYYSFGVNLTF
jgi:TonB-dependent receptor